MNAEVVVTQVRDWIQRVEDPADKILILQGILDCLAELHDQLIQDDRITPAQIDEMMVVENHIPSSSQVFSCRLCGNTSFFVGLCWERNSYVAW